MHRYHGIDVRFSFEYLRASVPELEEYLAAAGVEETVTERRNTNDFSQVRSTHQELSTGHVPNANLEFFFFFSIIAKRSLSGRIYSSEIKRRSIRDDRCRR
jgi:hypothetical protein